MTSTTYIFAGGGTGGHLFPGLAIAQALAARNGAGIGKGGEGGPRCVFLCSDRPLDTKILTDEGAEFRVIPAQPLGLRPRRLSKFLANWGAAVRESRGVLREAKRVGPVRVVAMGGFVAAPVVQAARVERVPVTLVNLDAVPGKANRWIARRVEKRGGGAGIFTAAPVRDAFAREWKQVPPIVRAQAAADAPARECRQRIGGGLDPERPTLMVTGGSQGARSINDFVLAFARAEPAAMSRWQVIHQCGKGADEALREAYRELRVPAVVAEFVPRMAEWWGAADVCVSRSGAGSVAEAWANHVPTLFLPYPYHRDQHQKLNAAPLVEAGAAVLATDLIDPQRNLVENGPVLRTLLTDGSKRAAMRAALERLGKADGAERIAEALSG